MKRKTILITFICIMATALISFTACADENDKLDEIKNRGELRVGVKTDVPFFALLNSETGEHEGLEIDITRKLAESILGDENAITFVPVTTITRESMLANNEIDFVIATFTITDERKEIMNFSRPYYVDNIGFLVRKDSGINSLSDAEGKRIGATFSSTAYGKLETNPPEIEISYELVGEQSYPEVKSSLLEGRVDVMSTDKSILFGYLDDDTRLLDEGYFTQEYGIATALENTALAKYIDNQLETMEADGTLEKIINSWLN